VKAATSDDGRLSLKTPQIGHLLLILGENGYGLLTGMDDFVIQELRFVNSAWARFVEAGTGNH
jgi:hypothetical protein